MTETPEQWLARLSTKEGILAHLRANGGACGLPQSIARNALQREGLIESYRSRSWRAGQRKWWRLTEEQRK